MPSPADPIDNLAQGFRGAQILFSAVRLGIFPALAGGPADAPGIARAVDIDARAARILLEALAGLELLEREGDRFALTPVAREQLLPESPHNRLAMLRHNAALYLRWGQLTEVARSGRPSDPSVLPADLQRTEAAFAAAMADVGRRSAGMLADMLDLGTCRTMLDAGGGPGCYAAEFARRYPALAVTLMDTPGTLDAARERLGNKLAERLTFRSGNLLTDDPGGPYDFILLSNVAHIFGPEDNTALVQRLASALNPGGRLCIKEFILNEQRDGPRGALIFAVNMLVNTPNGRSYSQTEMRDWCSAAGLTDVEFRPMTAQSGICLARRPQ